MFVAAVYDRRKYRWIFNPTSAVIKIDLVTSNQTCLDLLTLVNVSQKLGTRISGMDRDFEIKMNAKCVRKNAFSHHKNSILSEPAVA